jgi:hypothetical protein
MEASNTSETLVKFYQTTQRTPRDSHLRKISVHRYRSLNPEITTNTGKPNSQNRLAEKLTSYDHHGYSTSIVAALQSAVRRHIS